MNATKRLLVVSFACLTACAPPKPAPELPQNTKIPLETRKAQTATISSWNIHGAMSAKNKSKGWSATLNWLQTGANQYQIRLIGALGGGSVLVQKKGSTITLQDGAKISTASSADQLLLENTGIRLPVNNLYYWVRGLPAPGGVQSVEHDQYNHLTTLRQSGYTIRFTQYTAVKGIDLPSMIRLEGHGVMMKVIINSWGVS